MLLVDTQFRSGSGYWTQIGRVNDNRQKVHGTRGVPGNDNFQYVYKLECLDCGHCYGANGTNNHERMCPVCQGGEPALDH